MGYDDQNPDAMSYQSVPEKKPRGCFFYGCLFAVIFLVLGVVVVGGGLFWIYRVAINATKEYTDTAPEAMPPLTMPEAERQALRDKVTAYNKALNERKATEPLVLTADDLNALIDDNPKLKGRAHVEIKDDKIDSRISIPVGEFIPLGELQGRYLNGSAKVILKVSEGMVDVRLEDVTVKGKPLPAEFAKELRNRNVVRDSANNGNMDKSLAEVQSVVVKDGTVIITPRPIKADEPSKDATPPAAEAPKEQAPKEEPPKEEPAPPAEPSTPTPPAEPPTPKTPAEPGSEAPKVSRAA